MFNWLGGRKRRGGASDKTGEVALEPRYEAGPPFAVPGIAERGRAEHALADVRGRLGGLLDAEVSDQAFAALTYEHDGFIYHAEVGAADPRANETVRAILRQPDKRRFLITTDRHGFAGGLPLLVPDREVKTAVVFQDA